MAVWLKDRSLLFVQTPSTACTAIASVLRERVDCESLGEKHASLNDLLNQQLLGETELNSTHVVTGVRNPFDTLVSLYFKGRAYGLRDRLGWIRSRRPGMWREVRQAKRSSFPDWIKWLSELGHLDIVYYRTITRFRRPRIDQFIRFERAREGLTEALRRTCGLGSFDVRDGLVVLPTVNVTPGRRRDWRTYYDEESRAIVTRVVADDLTAFRYEF